MSIWKGEENHSNSVLAHNKITLIVDMLCQNQLASNLHFNDITVLNLIDFKFSQTFIFEMQNNLFYH